MRLGPTGPLLGAIRDYEYGLERIEFGSGDRVILYTDGVTEARSGNSFFGEERVLGFVQGTGTARDLARGLLDAVRAFVQGELRDDVAILVVKARTSRETEQEDRQEKAGA
jgi:serine phosphatase RsbU (regulator of sigma subunit)